MIPLWLVLVLMAAAVLAVLVLDPDPIGWLERRRTVGKSLPVWVPTGECICGREVSGDDLHVLVAVPDDDEALGIDGRTAVSADFCPEHCPGGCESGCPVPC